MKKMLTIKGKSQFDDDVDKFIQRSACGPVTAFVMLDYLFPETSPLTVNALYRLLGGTRIGLLKTCFIKNMRKLLGPKWVVATCTIDEVFRQIEENRPVAAKFDKKLNFRWLGKYDFDYHWVPVIGFEKTRDDILLIIHDNGGPNRESQVRSISYKKNQTILSFVKIEPIE